MADETNNIGSDDRARNSTEHARSNEWFPSIEPNDADFASTPPWFEPGDGEPREFEPEREPEPIRRGAPLDIDEIARQMQDKARTRQIWRRRARVALPLAAGAVFVVGSVAIALLWPRPSSNQDLAATKIDTATPTTTADKPAATPAPWCGDLNQGSKVRGAGPGDLSSGPAEILRLNHKFYVERDAAGMREVFAPGATVAPVEATQAAIAALPAGTQHCVHITAVAPDRFAVTVEERYQGGQTQAWDTVVSTGVQPDGRVLITSITAAGS
jgi:hypothetical protein